MNRLVMPISPSSLYFRLDPASLARLADEGAREMTLQDICLARWEIHAMTSDTTTDLIATIAIDLGKNVLHLVGMNDQGKIVLQA
jgi:hypothetical protein